MASIVDICNMALAHHGSDAVVSSIDPPDGSIEAGHCARFYPIARTELLEPYPWSFALKRAALAELAVNPSSVWAYAYELPSDCLSPVRVLAAGSTLTPSERDNADYTIEGTTVLTNEEAAVLLYITDVTDPSKFSPTFTTALSYVLGAYLAGPLIKGSAGADVAKEFRKAAREMAVSAAANDANGSAESAVDVPQSILARR